MITKSKLQRLSENCSDLLFFSEKIESNKMDELIENNRVIKQALRKIIIANEIADRMIVCITGLQGTGKTTLVKNFYDLDDSIMNIAIGRGERLPILITEKADVYEAEMYAVGIEKNNSGYQTVRKSVTQSEFIDLSKAEDDDTTIMYMEILVPQKYLSGNCKLSYMLLPGYERKDDYWKTLIDFSVQCSDTAIFVLTPSSLSGSANANLMDKIKEMLGDNVIYAITHSDLKTDDNSENKQTLMDMLEVDANCESKVICTGAYAEKEKNDKWKEQLKNAIEIYSANPSFVDQKSVEYINDVLIKELRPAVTCIKRIVGDNTDEILTNFEHSVWLDSFDKAAKKMRKRYEKSLNKMFKESLMHDEDKLNDVIAKRSKIKSAKRVVFGESLKDRELINQEIDEAMKDENGHYRCHVAFSNAIVECTDEICAKALNESQDDGIALISIGGNKPSTLLATKNNEESKLILRDICTIVSNDSKSSLVINNLNETMRGVVECGVQFFGLSTFCSMTDLFNSRQYLTMPELTKSGLTLDVIKESIQSTDKFALSVLGIAGLDLVSDGVLDFIPGFANALKISVPAAAGITGAIALLGATTAIVKDYNKMQLTDFYSYKKAIASVYDELKKEYLDLYDDYIESLREKVENYLINCIGDNEVVIDKQNAIIAIKNIKDDLDDIIKDLKDDSYELTKIIRG